MPRVSALMAITGWIVELDKELNLLDAPCFFDIQRGSTALRVVHIVEDTDGTPDGLGDGDALPLGIALDGVRDHGAQVDGEPDLAVVVLARRAGSRRTCSGSATHVFASVLASDFVWGWVVRCCRLVPAGRQLLLGGAGDTISVLHTEF